MRKTIAVWEREMTAYFATPMAYIVVAVFMTVFGWFFYIATLSFTTYSLSAFDKGPAIQARININTMLIEPLFQTLGLLLMMVIPLLTMRLVAEEKRSGTFELIMTSPISTSAWIMGKFAACVTLFSLMLGLTVYAPFLLTFYGNVDLGPIFSAYLGILLMGQAFIAFGLLASTLTGNQIIAAVIGLGGLLLLWVLPMLSMLSDGLLSLVIDYISLTSHLDDFLKGIIDTRHVIYYLTLIGFFLLAAIKVVESQKWK